MVIRSASCKSFRVQPAPHIGNFSIRIVDPRIEKRPGRSFAFRGIEQNRAGIEFFQARTKTAQGSGKDAGGLFCRGVIGGGGTAGET
jgi:hypothetical protein